MGPYKVYVENPPGDLDSAELRSFFEHAGPIVDAYVVCFPDGRSRNFGFLRFGNARAQRYAIADMHGYWISGHFLVVEEARGQDNAGVGEVSQYLGPSFTSNQAEYRALILGLEMALDNYVERLEIRGDSELVIRQLQGRYEVRSRRLAKLHRRVLELLRGFEEEPYLHHIPRDENEEADALANEALDEEFCWTSSESDSEDDY